MPQSPKIRITSSQVAILIPNLVFGKAIGFTSGILARRVGQEAWLVMLTSFLAGFLGLAVVTSLSARLPRLSPAEMVGRVAGRWPGKLMGLLLSAFYGVAYAISAITVIHHLNQYLLPDTPLWVFVIAWSLLIVYAHRLGLEVIARLTGFALLFTVLLNVLVVLGTIEAFKWTSLFPVFDHPAGDWLEALWVALSDPALVLMYVAALMPHIKDSKTLAPRLQWGLLASLVLTLTWPVFEIGVMGPEVTGQYMISCMQLARSAQLSIFLHRYELIMVTFFVWGLLAQCIVAFYALHRTVEVTLGLGRTHLGHSLAVAAAVAVLTYYLGNDHNRYVAFLAGLWPSVAVPIGFGVPLVLLIISALKRQKQTPTEPASAEG